MSHSYPTRHSYGPGGADRARVLRHLGRVGQPRAVVIALVVDEDLGLVLKPPEGAGMDDAVAVALKAGARRALRLGEVAPPALVGRSEEPTSELPSLMRISYAVFCLKKQKNKPLTDNNYPHTSITN